MRDDKRYYELRKEMFGQGATNLDLAEAIGKQPGYISSVFTGKSDFRLSEIWDIMELLKLSPKKMAFYFPRKGIKDEVQS